MSKEQTRFACTITVLLEGESNPADVIVEGTNWSQTRIATQLEYDKIVAEFGETIVSLAIGQISRIYRPNN